jgi:SagB-type dehydrogenase family enzyme
MNMRRTAVSLVIMLILCLVFFEFSGRAASPLEQTVSSRQSVRNFTSENISSQQLLMVLWSAYGYTSLNRTVPQIGYNHSLTVFAVNATGSYQYVPESNSVIAYDLSVNKEAVRSHDGGWPSDASVVLVVVWNETKMNNQYLASAEAGCLVQNVYLSAASLNLGTCCVGGVDSDGLRVDLRLPSAMTPLLVMPLGYPTGSFPPASPNYDLMTGNLPPVQYSSSSFEDALGNLTFLRNWSAEYLSARELSQLLWAAYGYTNVTSGDAYHRTTPSSWGIYPLVVFVLNATGVYRYSPENHSLSEMMQGDRRFEIANATAGQVWISEAPAVFLIVYNSSFNAGNTGDGGTVLHEFIEVDAGAVMQQIVLEASAWKLGANIVSGGLEDWNGTTAEQLRSFLGLSSSLIPLCVIPVGFPFTNKTTPAISMISPENKTYNTNDVALTFNVDEPYSWMGYSLDDRANVTISGNTTLSGVPDGFHHVSVYANDTAGNIGASSTVYFAVDTAGPEISEVIQFPAEDSVKPTDEVIVNATVVDATSGVKKVIMNYTTGNMTWLQKDMIDLGDGIYSSTIPRFPYGTNVTYVIVAEDNAGNIITSVETGYQGLYQVLTEFPSHVIILSFVTMTLLSVAVSRRKRAFRRMARAENVSVRR